MRPSSGSPGDPVTASSHAQLGSVPDWIGAIGTTLAFFVAFIVLFLDLRERRRAQASQVAAWFERDTSNVTLHVANSSGVPIYKVRVSPQFLKVDYETISYPLLEPRKDVSPLTIPLPGGNQVSNEFLGVQMLFSDSAGRRWKRLRNGKLRRKLLNYS
jgi:hypothetical protein